MACILQNRKVHWQHENNASKCIIESRDGTLLSSGESKLGKDDQFDKRVGRFISFKRAMKKLQIPKEEKAPMWNEFRAQIKQPITVPHINY